MAVGSKLLIWSILATLGLGCASNKDAFWSQQPSPPAALDIALQDGSLFASQTANDNNGKLGATEGPVGGAADVPAGPLGAGWVVRGVKLASWSEQEPTIPEGNPPNPTQPSSPIDTNAPSSFSPAAPAIRIDSPTAGAGDGVDATNPAGGEGTPPVANAVSGNPAAVNIVAGSGRLGELLGINRNGIRFGGLTIDDANGNLVGGLGPGKWTGNTLTIADLSIDLEKFAGWKGGLFGTEFLYYNGYGPGYSISNMVQGKNNPNALAGTVMGFNALSAAPPLQPFRALRTLVSSGVS
jgi:hypothetical protein